MVRGKIREVCFFFLFFRIREFRFWLGKSENLAKSQGSLFFVTILRGNVNLFKSHSSNMGGDGCCRKLFKETSSVFIILLLWSGEEKKYKNSGQS